jgi:nucleotide-binding universal stress UspA family protein
LVAVRFARAAMVAVSETAHLIGVASHGVTQFLYQNIALEYNDPNLTVYFDMLRQRAAKALEQFEPAARALGVTSCENRLINDETSNGFVGLARCADLVVIGQPNPAETPISVSRDFAIYVVLHSGRPVLIVPYAGHFEQVGQRILVAWNGSLEAERAIEGALPLLQRARSVEIAVFNAPAPERSIELPGADIVAWLRRQGVVAEVSQQRTKADIGNALLSLAADLTADLIVMGGYGHSRFREMLLGGATRTILESMTVPVLMAH